MEVNQPNRYFFLKLMMLIIYWESWPTSQVYGEKEVQVDDEATGKSLHSMKKVEEEIFVFHKIKSIVQNTWLSMSQYMKKKQSSLSNKLEELTVTDSDCGALDLMHASIGSS